MCKLKEYIENRRDMKAAFDPEPNPNDDMLMLLNALKKSWQLALSISV